MSDIIAGWQPTAPIANPLKRAKLLMKSDILQTEVLEVETPTMSQATVTDVHLRAF